MTDGDGIVGVLSVDDLLVCIARDVERLAHPIIGELIFGHHPTPVPAVP